MRVLVVHNSYRQAGGEDVVFAHEVAMLRGGGHDVATLTVSNDDIGSGVSAAGAAVMAIYSRSGRRRVADAIAQSSPDIVHVHNFFPQLSPSLFDACRAAGVPAVWTMHNFRVTCAGGMLFRAGAPCVKCVGGASGWGVVHRCYRGSLPGSAAVAAMIAAHRALGTWRHKVARFIAPSRCMATMLAAAGLSADRIVVKPNAIADPGPPPEGARGGALYVGRLSPEKGVDTLIAAWRALGIPLTVIGDGPQRAALEAAAPPTVRFVGTRDRAGVAAAMAQASALIVPSEWYENCPLVAIEAMARGTPVLAAGIGGLPELIDDGVTGLLFVPRDPDALAATVRAAFAAPARLASMGEAGRARYERLYTPAVDLAALTAIYHDAIAEAETPRSALAAA